MRGFLLFIRNQGVVGLGIAFVLAAAVTKLVTSFVNCFVTPLLNIVLGAASGVTGATFTIMGSKFLYGQFISSLIDFLVVTLIIYLAYEYLKLEKLDKPKEK